MGVQQPARPADAVWFWERRMNPVLRVAGPIGLVAGVVGIILAVRHGMEVNRGTRSADSEPAVLILVTAGTFVLGIVWLALLTKRHSLAVHADGVLRSWRGYGTRRELDLRAEAEVVLVRDHFMVSDEYGQQRVDYLAVVPDEVRFRRRPGKRPPRDWLVVPKFPDDRLPDLRDALQVFTTVTTE